MELILANYKLILGLIALVIVIGFSIYKFLTQPTSKQKEQIKKFILILVIEVEATLGSETGKVKLSYVFNEQVAKFPHLRFIAFSTIEMLIEEALDEMRHLLETNPKVAEIVKEVE